MYYDLLSNDQLRNVIGGDAPDAIEVQLNFVHPLSDYTIEDTKIVILIPPAKNNQTPPTEDSITPMF